MSDEIVSGVLGFIGGLLGGGIGYLTTIRATRQQLEEANRQIRAGQKWAAITETTPVVSELLTFHTAEQVRHDLHFLQELEDRYERQFKTLYMQGDQIMAQELGRILRPFLKDLRKYHHGQLTQEYLEVLRIRTRNKITDAISRHKEVL